MLPTVGVEQANKQEEIKLFQRHDASNISVLLKHYATQ